MRNPQKDKSGEGLEVLQFTKFTMSFCVVDRGRAWCPRLSSSQFKLENQRFLYYLNSNKLSHPGTDPKIRQKL